MDDSDAPTDCAINNRKKTGGSTVVSAITTGGLREQEDFTSGFVTLCGRDGQMSSLRESYERVMTGPSELVLIEGASGTGKSSLVETMREVVTQNDGGYFVSGKFDQLQTRKEPFSAIAAALSDLCDLVVQSSELDDRRRDIISEFGSSSTKILSRIVPSVALITGEESEDDEEPPTVQQENYEEFKQSCQAFLRSVPSEDHPLLIFLDDLQWADESSINLIKSFIQDSASNNVLLCGAYRGNEVDVKALLCVEEQKLEEVSTSSSSSSTQFQMPVTDIQVANLDRNSLSAMLAQLLHMDKESNGSLTELLLKKTKGNPHSVIQVLQLLKSKKLLTFSNESFSWEWNMHAITSEVSENPEEILAEQIGALPEIVQETVLMAAYVGNTFCREVLQEILFDPSHRPEEAGVSNEELIKRTKGYLNAAIDTGLIVAIGGVLYKFAHNSSQTYLYHSVGSEEDRSLIHLRIGRVLLRMVADDEIFCHCNNLLVFLAMANMAKGVAHIEDDGERVRTMKLCLDAAGLAVAKACTGDAKDYLDCAIKLQKDDDWVANKQLVVDIHNSYAEALSCTGCYDECDKVVDDVLSHATEFSDRHRAHTTKLLTLSSLHKYSEAVEWAFNKNLTEQKACMGPKPSGGRILYELLVIKRAMRRMDASDFLALPHMQDEQKLATMKTLTIVAKVAHALQEHGMFLYCVLRRIRLSMKHGTSESTASAVSGYAVILLRSMGRVDEAVQVGQVALQLATQFRCVSARTMCLATSSTFLAPWRAPLSSTLETSTEAYKCALKSGTDLAVSAYGLGAYTECRLNLGAPLSEVEGETQRMSALVKTWQAHEMHSILLVQWQYALNLLGKSDDPLLLRGDAVDDETFAELSRSKDKEKSLMPMQEWTMLIYSFRLNISFEEWGAVKQLLPLVLRNSVIVEGHYNQFLTVAYIAMGALGVYECTGESKYRKLARKQIKQMKKFADDNVPDAKPLLVLLEAEWEAIVNKKDDTRDAFDEAIQGLKTSQLIGFETMATQRAMHSMKRHFHLRDSQTYMTKLIDRHREWGNLAMVEWLQSVHGDVLRCVKPTYEIKVTNQSSACEETLEVPGSFNLTAFG